MTNLEREKHSGTGKRMSLLFLIIFLSLAVLIFRLAFFQLSKGDELLKQSEYNRYVQQPIPAPRGLIYDRSGNELVRNKPSYTITFQRLSGDLQDPYMLIAQLQTKHDIFPISETEMWNAMDPYGDKYLLGQARKVIKNATPQQVAYVREHAEELPGFNVVVEPVREYPGGNLASHVIGYLNDIPNDYWKEHKDEYQQTDMIGTAGIEKQYEQYLHGKDGTLKVEVNRYYQPLNDVRTEEPVKGHDLYLTINKDLQAATEKALATQVQTLHRTVPTVKEAAAVAMNPKTGEILAMASYPSFDPNQWVKGWTTKEYNDIFAPAEKNRAMQELYQPGSTIKMASVLIGLNEGIITPNTVIDDPGTMYFGNAEISSWKRIGSIDSYRALAESSNIYMMRIFEKFGKYNPNMSASQVEPYLKNTVPATLDKMLEYHKQFGLGVTTTGLDLPYEATGKLDREGNLADLAWASFGQSEYYTLMQLAQYTSTIANDGKRMKPYLVSKINNPDGTLAKQIDPEVQGEVTFTQEQLQAVQRGMYDVIHKPYGTFYSVLGNYPKQVAGKTGTSETGRGTENSLFVGYAPYDNPEIAIAVIIPDNKSNSHSYDSVGPVSKAMFDAYFFPEQAKQQAQDPKDQQNN